MYVDSMLSIFSTTDFRKNLVDHRGNNSRFAIRYGFILFLQRINLFLIERTFNLSVTIELVRPYCIESNVFSADSAFLPGLLTI